MATKITNKKFTECPFCHGSLAKKYTGIPDRLDTTTKKFSIVECNDCHIGFINPAPVGDVSKFYPTNYLSSEGESGKRDGFDLEKWYRYNQYDYDAKLLRRATGLELKNAKSYIDIGCGSGERVTFADDRGCKRACGVDKFDFAKSNSKQHAKIINSEILKFKPTQKFQVVSLFHVLEHLINPHEVLTHLRKYVVQRKGYIIIQVPNYGSFERRIFKSKWFGLDVPRHYWDFNEPALKKLLEDQGFRVLKSYQKSAPLHPVSIAPSIFRDLDVQRIWVNKKHGNLYKKSMKLLWAVLTILTIPLSVLQNLFNRSSMLTVIASVD